MNTVFSLSPLLSRTVGFERFNDLFESLSDGEEPASSYPPYNIEKHGEDRYGITMAVAGFSDKDLSITVERDRVVVAGRLREQAGDAPQFLYRGIAARPFERVFRLADYMKVTGAEMRNGLLHIALEREVPEEQKPRTIAIHVATDTKVIDHASADTKDRKKAA